MRHGRDRQHIAIRIAVIGQDVDHDRRGPGRRRGVGYGQRHSVGDRHAHRANGRAAVTVRNGVGEGGDSRNARSEEDRLVGLGAGGDDTRRAVGTLGDRRDREGIAICVGVVSQDTDGDRHPHARGGRISHGYRRGLDRDRNRADGGAAPSVADRVGEGLRGGLISQARRKHDRRTADLRRGAARSGDAGNRKHIAVEVGVVAKHVDGERDSGFGRRHIVDRRGRMIEGDQHGGGGEAAPAIGGGVSKLGRAGGADIPVEDHCLGVGADDRDRAGRLRHGADRQHVLVRIGVVGEDGQRRGGPQIDHDGVSDRRRRQVLGHRHVGRGRAAAAVADRIGKGLDRQHTRQRRELDRSAHDRQGGARVGRNRGDRQWVAVDVPIIGQDIDGEGLAGEREDGIRQRHGRSVDGDGHGRRGHAAATIADRVAERVHARRACRRQVAQRFAAGFNRDRADPHEIDVRLGHRSDNERISVRIRVIGQHLNDPA